ncbi:MAG: ATP-binding protein [Rheinheimera sp.]|nr:ATP-binding protein [Rheinheimera sp.]
MRRLFLHFYLFMLLVLVAIGWSVERLWEHSQTETIPGWVNLLGQSLAYQLTAPDSDPKQVAAQLNLSLQNLPVNAIDWSPEELEALARGQLVPLFGENYVYFYQQIGDQLQQFGPVEVEVPSNYTYLFTMLFFLLLGVALAVWLWPIARDISHLQRQLAQFGQGMQLPTQPLPDRSLLAPIAQSVQQMANQIKRLVNLQREMTHAVSHELRTPLARLSFAIEMQPLSDAEKLAMLGDIRELDQLVDEMLDYARMESQVVRLQFEEVDLTQLIDNLSEKLAPLPGATIVVERPAIAWQLADGHYLERALQNLLMNAKRHAQDQVLLSLQFTNDEAIITVDDDGPGIPVAQRDAILQPFVRLDAGRNKGQGGFGLGLAIVSRIVNWHQGQLGIDSSPLGGARFSIRLPKKIKPLPVA